MNWNSYTIQLHVLLCKELVLTAIAQSGTPFLHEFKCQERYAGLSHSLVQIFTPGPNSHKIKYSQIYSLGNKGIGEYSWEILNRGHWKERLEPGYEKDKYVFSYEDILGRSWDFYLMDNKKPLMVFKPRRLTHITDWKSPVACRLYLGRFYDLCLGTGNDSSSSTLWRAEKDNSLTRRSWQK